MSTSSTITEARDRFVSERHRYEDLAAEVRAALAAELRKRGVEAEVTGRAKEIASFVTKAFRKMYTDPWEETTDKAGVRVTLFYERDVQTAVDTVLELYPTDATIEDKRQELEVEKLGYLGLHVTVKVPNGSDLLPCEIQVRTSAQGSWAVVSHHLLYKPDLILPDPVRRSLYRLLALVELFDSEVEHAMSAFMSLPEYVAASLKAAAERAFYEFRTEPYDQQLTMLVLDAIKPAFASEDLGGYASRLDDFVDAQRPRIAERLAHYRDGSAHPILSQPEAIVLFERIETAADQLEEAWMGAFPEDLLDDVKAAWGYDL